MKNFFMRGSFFCGSALLTAVLLFEVKSTAQTLSQTYGDSLTKKTQTVFVQGTAGQTTYNSSVANSTSTGTSTNLTVGGYAGENRVLGVFLSSENQDISFSQADARIKTTWNDLRMQARFGYFFPSVGVSLSQMQITAQSQNQADIYGTGYNAGVGVKVPITTDIIAIGDVMAVQTGSSHDDTGNETKLGTRAQADASLCFDIIKSKLDLLVGYQATQFSVKKQDVAEQKEFQSEPYAGLRVGAYF